MYLRLGIFRQPFLVLSVTAWITLFLAAPSISAAALAPSRLSRLQEARDCELAKIRQVLEQKVAVRKMTDFGFAPEEVAAKLSSMSDEQIHYLASLSDRVTAGGSAVGAVIGVLIIVILVLVILKLWNKRIIIQ